MRNIILSVIGVLVIVGAIFAAIKISESNDKPKPEVKKVVKTVFVEEAKNGTWHTCPIHGRGQISGVLIPSPDNDPKKK